MQHQESWKQEMAASINQLKAYLDRVDAVQGAIINMPLVQNGTNERLQEQHFRSSVPYFYKAALCQ